MPVAGFNDGDILLCKGEDLISRLIMWGTKSTYSHVAIIASADLGIIIEAIPEGGVRAIAIKSYKTLYDVYRVKSEFLFNHAGVISYLIAMLARRYDYNGVFKLGWKMFMRRLRLFQLFGLKVIRNKHVADKLQEDNDYFCSELCYRAFYVGGKLDIVPQVESAETTSPGDIARSKLIQQISK